MTSFNNPQKGSYINSSDFTKMKNAIKALTQKTMDFNLSSSNLDSIDTNRGSLIYAKDMNTMMRIISDMGKYCVCKNKEACNCKEACNSNCSCRGHCTCNSYDPCSCVSYTPPPPCTCKSYTCSCQSYTQPCTCKNDSGCGCKSYSNKQTEITESSLSIVYSNFFNNNSRESKNSIILIKNSSNSKNIVIKDCYVKLDIYYTPYASSAPQPTQTYINTITNEGYTSDNNVFFDFRNVFVPHLGTYLIGSSYGNDGMSKADWDISVYYNPKTTISCRICKKQFRGIIGKRLLSKKTDIYLVYDKFECRGSSNYFKSIPYGNLQTVASIRTTVSYNP